jgi:hypothetical protein
MCKWWIWDVRLGAALDEAERGHETRVDDLGTIDPCREPRCNFEKDMLA